MRFRVLGPLEVEAEQGSLPLGGRKQRLVLAHLVRRPNEAVPTDVLIDDVWGEEPPEAAKSSLQGYVSHLRSAVGADRIDGRGGGYRLRIDEGELDALEFERLTSEARGSLDVDPAEAADAFGEALAMWRGPAFADLADELSLAGEVARLQEARVLATEDRISAEMSLGRHASVVGELEALTLENPLRERLWGLRMLALYRSGRQAEALAVFQQARDLLAEQLGIDPSRSLQRLHERILAQDTALSVASRRVPGLAPVGGEPGEITPGDRFGEYRIGTLLGRGGMSVVYLAEHEGLKRNVALKLLAPQLSDDARFRERFARESQLAASIDHPNVIPIYEAGEAEGRMFIAMRYVDGTDLQTTLRESGPLQPARAVGIVRQVADALDAAHARGLVHRDVKPANILISRMAVSDGRDHVYLSDFGLTTRASSLSGLSHAGGFVGTLDYAAPEQFRATPLDARTDVYALGAVLFESLAGHPPFVRDSEAALMHAHLVDPPPALSSEGSGLATAFDEVIARAMAKDPADRFQTGDELVRAADAAASARAGGGAALRTFLIADIRGYTTFTHERGDEAAAALAMRFAGIVREIVESGGGSVVELRGDEALAVFSSARQAIGAGTRLQARLVEETVVDPSLPLAVGVGLDAGEAVVVEGGFRGGALNRAARLCAGAGPGEVLASQEVVHLAGRVDGIVQIDRGDVSLKGLADPVRVIALVPEGWDPAQDLAFRRALGPDAARSVPAVPGFELPNPYKGLRPFEEGDAPSFFGREALTAELVERLAATRFLAVVGPSGSGKSSVVGAGLVPALRRGAVPGSERWVVVEMVPGAHPMIELEAGLLRAAPDPPAGLLELLEGDELGLLRAIKRILPETDGEMLLIVDQLEEVFTLVDEEAVRAHFLGSIVTAVTDPHARIRVVAALRADFYDRPLLYPGFAGLMRSSAETVVPLTPEELERAITGPAHHVGVEPEGGLLLDVLAEVSSEPGALPLLQYALTELFERREGNIMTLEAYRTIGGVSGAITGRAEEIYAALDDVAKEAARQLFLRLLTLGEGAHDARRRALRSEIAAIDVDQDAMGIVLERFVASRLLSFDRDSKTHESTVEVAHEALFTKWGRLAAWIEQHRSDLERHEAFAHAAEEWEAAGRDPDYLLTGSRLAEHEDWAAGTTMQLTGRERDFLDAERARKHDEDAEGIAQQEQRRALERRARTRLVALVVALAMILAVAALGTVVWRAGRPPDVALVFRGDGDAGFNDMIAAGFDRGTTEFGIRVERVATPDDQFRSQIRRLSEDGLDLIVTPAGDCSFSLAPVAADHPGTHYVVLDCLGEVPANVAQIWFASEEGSFLAGAAAALKSETGTIGFVGGMDFPLIWAFGAGFEAGAHHVDPTIEVKSTYLTQYPDFSGFTSPELAARAAAKMYRDGADVVYQAAGAAGIGVFQAAVAESEAQGRHLWAIGVDSDQYQAVMRLNPDLDPASWQSHILTSMVKRYDRMTHLALEEFSQGRFSPGIRVFGLAEGGVDISYTGGYIDDLRPTIDELRAQIISGEIDVPSVPPDKELEAADWPPELIPP